MGRKFVTIVGGYHFRACTNLVKWKNNNQSEGRSHAENQVGKKYARGYHFRRDPSPSNKIYLFLRLS